MKKSFLRIFQVILCAVFLAGLSSVLYAQESSSPHKPGVQSVSRTIAPFLKSNQVRKKILDTAAVTIFAYLLLFVLIGIINKRIRNIKTRHVARKNTIYAVNFLLISGIFLIWLQNINSLTILLGFASAGLALALQEAILCVAGWGLLVTRRPFEAGDRIEINGVKGDVIDVRIFQTSMLEIGNWVDADQSTGRIVNIPNSFVFKAANYNYSRGFEFIWNEIPVLVTFESDWQKAYDIMMVYAKRQAEGLTDDVRKKIEIMKNRYMIFYGKLTPIVYVNIKDSGVELTLRYLTEAKNRRDSHDEFCRAILEEFSKEPTVNFAYPTYRIVKE